MDKVSLAANKITKVANGYFLLEVLENESPTSFQVVDINQIPQRGKVLKVGGDTYYEGGINTFKCPVKEGDVIAHSGYGYEDIRINGEKLRICPFSKYLCTIEESN